LKKKSLILLVIGAILLLFALRRGHFTNSVIFTGDEWDYQSIAVNYCDGHGYPVTGLIEEIDRYKIVDLTEEKIRFWQHFSGIKAFHRPPFYPVFLCVTYRLFGVNPLIIKYLQLIVLLCAGILLVVAGKLFWGEKGYFIGLLGFISFFILNRRFPEHLMPENWQFLFLSIITICLYFHYRGSVISSILLGTILGISVLNKGTTLLLFPLVILCDLYCMLFKRKGRLLNTLVFLIGFLAITGIWSGYLSSQVHHFTFVSTQSNEVLLDGNNEYCSDGLWHPEWRDDINAFYNADHGTHLDMLRVISFYSHNPEYLLNIPAKIKAGFSPLLTFSFLLTLLMILLAIWLFKRSRTYTSKLYRYLAVPVALGLIVLAVYFGFFSGTLNKLQYSYLVILMLSLYALYYNQMSVSGFLVPREFILIFFNFFIFSVVFYVCNETYSSRYVKTMEGIFLLTDFYLLAAIYKVLLSVIGSGQDVSGYSHRRDFRDFFG
jgi:4-amino-4-deoxy-L-arabinose transferase-like glycosyltransferase